jgi:adenine-specific DNA-methyltransferase
MLDQRVSAIEHVLPLELDPARRRSLGIYYTPRSAATLLARWAIRSSEDQVLEPSFGGCAILASVVRELETLGCQAAASQIRGFDVDPSAFVHLERMLGHGRFANFHQVDFLESKPDGVHVDAVIANPPFVSYHRMDAQQRDAVLRWRKTHVDCLFPMTASLWAYFLAHAVQFLRLGGRAAFVLPSAALTADYAAPLLHDLRQKFGVLALIQVSEQLFIEGGASERAVIFLADGFCSAGVSSCNYFETTVATVSELGVLLSRGGAVRQGSANDPWADGGPADVLQESHIRGDLLPLGSLARATIGEVVGDTAFFVKPVCEWEALGVGSQHLAAIATRVRQLPGISIMPAEVESAYSGIPRLLVAPARRQPKAIANYLAKYPAAALATNATFAKREPWYNVSYHSGADAFIGSLSHGSPRVVLNVAGISCGNGLYKLTSISRKGLAPWVAIASLSTPFRLSAEIHGRLRGSGALKLEPSDVHRLLIPAPPPGLTKANAAILLDKLESLIRRGEYERATREVDRVALLETRRLTAQGLRSIQDRLQDIRNGRLPSARRKPDA